jgi:restriction system protein
MDNKYDYHQLKVGKHGIPSWDGFIPVVLAVAGQQESWRVRDLCRAVADKIGLPNKLRTLGYPNYPDDLIAENRVNWALSDLAIAGLLRRPQRGIYVITLLGKQLFDRYDLKLTAKIVHEQPAYLAHQKELAARKQNNIASDPSTESQDEPPIAMIDQIRNKIEKFNSEVEAELLERIREADPRFFEGLVADLLTAMGYQGEDGHVLVTPQSHDGGIDGIINQDPLGTSTVYYQAKRYQADNIVQRPAIEGFFGALSRVHADRGVFISTSGFSAGAVETAREFSIVLIDGVQLTNLLLHYHVGVQAKRKYELFQIDEDYFD